MDCLTVLKTGPNWATVSITRDDGRDEEVNRGDREGAGLPGTLGSGRCNVYTSVP